MDEQKIAQVYQDMVQNIVQLTQSGQEGHLAIKFTALISIDIMTKVSGAQQFFQDQILKFSHQEFISKEEIKQNLTKFGIACSDDELVKLMNLLRF